MGTNNKHGFTIVETMLFMAVSGVLTIGILAGSGVAIAQQRYRDSVNSFRGDIQKQFNDVANVSNSRSSDWVCSDSAIVTPSGDGSGVPRGASDCVIFGRYIRSYNDDLDNDGKVLFSYPVIGHLKSGAGPADDDIEAFGNYNLSIASIGQVEERLEWGAVARVPGLPASGDSRVFSMLIVRSPLSGGIRTYIPEPGNKISDPDIFDNIISTDNVSRGLKVCIDSADLFVPGGNMAVQIAGNASNQSAVETLGDDSGC